VTVAAAHDGYRHLAGRPCHRRRWTLTGAGLEVDDRITGAGRHEVAVRWHLPPATDVSLIDGGALISTSAGKFAVTVAGTTPLEMEIESAPIAFGFLRTAAAPVLTCRAHAGLPLRLTTSWQRAD
jgi:hypothetical protein